MVSNRPIIFKSSSAFINPLMTVPSAPITIGISVTLMFHGFSVLYEGVGIYFSFRFIIIIIIIIIIINKILNFYLIYSIMWLEMFIHTYIHTKWVKKY